MSPKLWQELSNDVREALAGKLSGLWGAPDDESAFNGLAIDTDYPQLGRYYRDNVIGGPDSFEMDVANYRDFPKAIRLKLLREIRPLLSSLPDRPLAGRLAEVYSSAGPASQR